MKKHIAIELILMLVVVLLGIATFQKGKRINTLEAQYFKYEQQILVLKKDQKEALESQEEKSNTIIMELTKEKENFEGLYELLLEQKHQLSDELKKALSEKETFLDYDQWMLEAKGIEDKNIILEDLQEHSEIIPFEGVHGGIMRFGEIHVINDRWVFARFEDGHVMGCGLYEYHIDEDKNILWEVVEAYVD